MATSWAVRLPVVLLFLTASAVIARGENGDWNPSGGLSTVSEAADQATRRIAQDHNQRAANPAAQPQNVLSGLYTACSRGKIVHAQFSIHQTNQGSQFAAALNGGSLEEISRNLDQMIDAPGNASLIRTLDDNRAALEKLLSEKKIAWMGIEASPEEMRSGVPIDAQVRDLNELKETLRPFSERQIESILTLLYDPHVRLRALRPDLFDGIRYVPLDSHEPKQRALAAGAEQSQIRSQLIRLGISGAMTPAQFMRLQAASDGALKRNAPLSTDEIGAALGDISSPEARSLAENYLGKANEFLSLSADRDEAMAAAITAERGEGYVALGSAHGPGVLRRLDGICSPLPSPSPTAPR